MTIRILTKEDIETIYKEIKNNIVNEWAVEKTFIADIKILDLYTRTTIKNNTFDIKQNLRKISALNNLDDEDRQNNTNRRAEIGPEIKELRERLNKFKEYEEQAIEVVEHESLQRVNDISYWFDKLEDIIKKKKLVKKKVNLEQHIIDYYKDFTTDTATIYYFLKLDCNNTDNIKDKEVRKIVSDIMNNVTLLAFAEGRPYSNSDMWNDMLEASMKGICEEQGEEYQEISDIESEIDNLESELFEISPELIIAENKALDLEIKLVTLSLRYACALGSYKEHNYLYNEAKEILS